MESARGAADARAATPNEVAAPREIESPTPAADPREDVSPPRPTPEPVRPAESGVNRATEAQAEPAREPVPEQRSPDDAEIARPTCTQAQLRRFIKSRPWVPMHELRRRFGINGGDDDVSPIHVGEHTLFIGLPPDEGHMMGQLLDSGDIGCELSLDPVTPVVIGVYPMRPVPRG